MKRTAMLFVFSLLAMSALSPSGSGQEKPKADEKAKSPVASTPVKIQIVFTEFEGDKKVKSLPYTLYANAADAPFLEPGWVKMRIGTRVPVYVGNNSMQYLDVGTNIDARSAYTSESRLLLQLSLERSWVEGDVPVPMTKSDVAQSETPSGHFREPIIRTFRSDLDMKLREGQTAESTIATDPVSGKVLKVEVSFTILK
jgi:hypothetical protein